MKKVPPSVLRMAVLILATCGFWRVGTAQNVTEFRVDTGGRMQRIGIAHKPPTDTDGDGLADTFEAILGTDPNNPDSDGDGTDDFSEKSRGTDPLDPASGAAPSAPPTAPAALSIYERAATSLTLIWAPSEPDYARGRMILRYEIWRNGVKLTDSSGPVTQQAVPFSPSGPVWEYFSVRAIDDQGTPSAFSSEVVAPREGDGGFAALQVEAKYAVAGAAKSGFLGMVSNSKIYRTAFWHSTERSLGAFEKVPVDSEQDLSIQATYQVAEGQWGFEVTGNFLDRVRAVSGAWVSGLPSGIFGAVLLSLDGKRLGTFTLNPERPRAAFGLDTATFAETSGVAQVDTIVTSSLFGDSFHLTRNKELILSNEFTDDDLRTQVDELFAVANGALPSLSWFEIASASSDGLFVGPIFDFPPYLAQRATLESNGVVTSMQARGAAYRFRFSGSQTQQVRWAEVFQPENGGAPQVLQVRSVTLAAAADGAFTQEFTLAPPEQIGGVELIQLGYGFAVGSPLDPGAGEGSRLYLVDALFTGGMTELALSTQLPVDPFGSVRAVISYPSELVRLVAIDPALPLAEGIAQGYTVTSGSDLLNDPNRPGVGGWRLIAIAVAPGSATIEARFSSQFETFTLSRTLTILPVAHLAVDANRDGVIRLGSEGASDATSAGQPFRFWANDDDDSGDLGGDDIPGNGASDFATGIAGPSDLGSDFGVDGARDLIDWFPVFLDVKQLLPLLPSSATVKYKLKHGGNALSFVYTDLTRERAFAYQKERIEAGFGFSFDRAPGEAQATQITATGAALSDGFLTRINDQDAGVILVEAGAATDMPLSLVVEKDGTVIAEVKLQLSVAPVETMFRHLNLHDRDLPDLAGAMNGGPAQPEAMGDPEGFPDDPNSDSRWLIFVHGFNVGGQASRGWNAEMFKRCYWSGNKARFVGVSWFGNPDDPPLALPADYHLAMRNAMLTAPMLAREINALPGNADSKTMFAHSLGCGIISSAIADHGLNLGRVCFVDAALPLESFDGRDADVVTLESDGMTPAAWKTYDPKLYAANWFSLFDPANDARGRLTWNRRFSRSDGGQTDASPFVYNFYSSTEDVLAEFTGELPSTLGGVAVLSWDGIPHGSFGWVWQEKGKGNRQDYGIVVAELTHLGSRYGGWGFNLTDPADAQDPIYYFADGSAFGLGKRSPSSVVPGSTAPNWQPQFRRAPLFDPGYGPITGVSRSIDPSVLRGPDWIPQLYDTTADTTAGSGIAAVAGNRDQLLAEAIPALTWCMGSHESSRLPGERNFNLPSLVNQNNWPRGKPDGVTPEWRHSDMREVAYFYQSGVFDKIVELSKP